MRRSLLALIVVLTFAAPPAAQAADGDIIVERVAGLDRGERRALRADAGVELVAALPIERTELVQPASGDVGDALAALRADDGVVYAEPDRVATVNSARGSFWGLLWGLDNTGQDGGLADADIDAPEAWLRSEGAGVTVAVVDTGVDAGQVDLAGQLAGNSGEQGPLANNGVDDDRNGLIDDHAGWNFVSGNNLTQDGYGHGTHVSGTIAAAGGNSAGIIGVAPKAKVMPLRALDDTGSGWMSDVADAFAYAGRLGVPIVNASFGGPYSATVEHAIAAHPGTLYVASAGNDHANADVAANAYPCALALANVVCVGASDDRDQPAGFSNFGAASVDLFAPGVGILSTWIGSPATYATVSGTSMAAPHVAGAAALVEAARPGSRTADLRAALLSSVDVKPALSGLAVTGGRLNADAAVGAILGAGPTPSPTPTPPPVATPAPAAPAATPAPTPIATPAPATLVNLRIGGSLRTRKGRLRVTFSLSRAASVRFTVTRRGSRRPLAGWSSRGHAGANRVTLSRRLPTRRTLKPGSYTLAVDLDRVAKTSTLFRVR